jgi:hypothetical protein
MVAQRVALMAVMTGVEMAASRA